MIPRHWVVTGAGGQLGSALVRALAGSGARVTARDSRLDVRDAAAVAGLLDAEPGAEVVLVNAAAYTKVDACETEQALARAINTEAPARLADLCAARGAKLVHVSTDFVFDGRSETPYREDDAVNPLSEYGRSKLGGEQAVLAASQDFLVARTAWVFGAGTNFVSWLLARAQALGADPSLPGLRVVDDQRGSPTYAEDLAEALLGLVERGASGLYHLCNQGAATRWEWARAVLDLAGLGALELGHARSAEFPTPATRPSYSVLDCSRAESEGITLRRWQEAVAAYLDSPFSPLGDLEKRR